MNKTRSKFEMQNLEYLFNRICLKINYLKKNVENFYKKSVCLYFQKNENH